LLTTSSPARKEGAGGVAGIAV
jgi:hypothetical protein